MTTQHTQGRLRVPDDGSIGSIQTESGMAIGQTFQTRPIRGAEDNEERKANASRLVACWNACEGIPTTFLEFSALHEITQNLLIAKAQRDELLAALKEIATAGVGSVAPGFADIARAAIAKVEGKA